MRRRALLALFLAAFAATGLRAEETGTSTPDPRTVVGPPRGRAFTGAALETESRRIASLLRCPVCQGLSVADSPTGMALNLRQQVHEMVAAGYDEEQVLAYFEKSYGEFVRLKPPLRGVNWLVWGGPLGGLLLGAVVIWRFLRSRAATAAGAREAGSDEPLPNRDSLPADPSLVPYVLRVRERVYGWPGGIAPAPVPPAPAPVSLPEESAG